MHFFVYMNETEVNYFKTGTKQQQLKQWVEAGEVVTPETIEKNQEMVLEDRRLRVSEL